MLAFLRGLNWKNIVERAIAGLFIAVVSVVCTLALV